MEKRKPNDLPPEQCLAVDTDTLANCCAVEGTLQYRLGSCQCTHYHEHRVLWSVQRIKEYLYDISG